MRFVLLAIAIALIVPAAASADRRNHHEMQAKQEGSSWIMDKKMRRMKKRRAAAGLAENDPGPRLVIADPQPMNPVPEPSAGLLFGAGALIASAAVRRRKRG